MLRWRLLLGTLFIAAIAGLCWLDWQAATPGIWLFPLALVIAWTGSGEILWLASARDLKPIPAVIYAGNTLIVCANWLPLLVGRSSSTQPLVYVSAALAIGVLLAFAGEMRRYERPGNVTERLAIAVFALAYLGLMLSFVVQLRLIGTEAGSRTLGIVAVCSLVVVVKLGDIGAYTTGRLFGRHRMAPVLSPGKTWEGAAGGLALACLGSWLVFERWLPTVVVPHSMHHWGWLAFGVLVGAAGMFGDLAESLLKRDLGRKDSSPWMPGFGGVLDILDSILLGAPVAWLCWALHIVGP
jgi:phosphatidate cytidylyltransferase